MHKILLRELGITNSQSTNTYKHSTNINHNTLLKKHSNDLFRYLEIQLEKRTYAYYQFTCYLSYIKMQLKSDLL